MCTNSLLFSVWGVLFECSLVRLNEQFFLNNNETLSHHQLNFKRRLIVVNVRFENWGISLE